MSPPNDTDDADDADNDTEAKKSETESVRTPERNGNGPTKRKKSLTDTPTIPVVTNSLSQYDAVLAEAQDFIQAAAEAQNLGRLSISASYLALSHSRLIGLAKRFDLAAPSASKNEPPVLDDQLKALLPADVEWDQAMMAHLASAAAEYHAARTQPARRWWHQDHHHHHSFDSTASDDYHRHLTSIKQLRCTVRVARKVIIRPRGGEGQRGCWIEV